MPGIRVSRFPIGGLTFSRANSVLEEQTAQYVRMPLLVYYKDRSWDLTPAELGVRYETWVAMNRAYAYGREGTILSIPALLQVLASEVQLPLSYLLDESALEASFSAIEDEIAFPNIPPSVEVLAQPDPDTGSRVVVSSGEDGLTVDRSVLRTMLHDRLSALSSDAIEVQTLPLPAWRGRVDEAGTTVRAQLLLPKRLILHAEGDPAMASAWELSGEDLVHFLSFDGGFQMDKIASYSATLRESFDRPPRNAVFEVRDGRVVEFAPDQPGMTIEVQTTTAMLRDALTTLETRAEDAVTVAVPVTVTPAAITAAQVNNLGIEGLLGRGVSTFHGSIANREHNITLASSRVSGALVPPGAHFSFNEAVGSISAATGYRQAYIIKSGRTILDDGGGVCQVSTTLFRAALAAGLPIVERTAHSYRVIYYEQNEKPGFDATVFAPRVDLVFRNDTPGYLLIQAQADTKTNTLVFEIYGTSDGRVATVTNHRVWDVTPPPPDLYQDDPTLPVGVTKQVDWKAWGAKVKFEYRVKRNGEIIFEKTFYSNFLPWQSVFLRGTAP